MPKLAIARLCPANIFYANRNSHWVGWRYSFKVCRETILLNIYTNCLSTQWWRSYFYWVMSYLWNKSHPMEFTKSVIVLFYYCFWGICALLATYWSFWSFFVKGAIFYIGTTMIASHFGPELSMYLLDHDKSPLPLKGKCSVRCWLHIVRWLNWLLFSMESSGVYKQAVPVLLPLAQIGLTGDRARAQNCHSRVVHIKCP